MGACTFQAQVALGGPRRTPTPNVLVMEGDHLARRSILSAGTPSRALYAHATVAEKVDEVRRFPEEVLQRGGAGKLGGSVARQREVEAKGKLVLRMGQGKSATLSGTVMIGPSLGGLSASRFLGGVSDGSSCFLSFFRLLLTDLLQHLPVLGVTRFYSSGWRSCSFDLFEIYRARHCFTHCSF